MENYNSIKTCKPSHTSPLSIVSSKRRRDDSTDVSHSTSLLLENGLAIGEIGQRSW